MSRPDVPPSTPALGDGRKTAQHTHCFGEGNEAPRRDGKGRVESDGLVPVRFHLLGLQFHERNG